MHATSTMPAKTPATITINIRDINERPGLQPVLASISEDLSIGSDVVAEIHAEDIDSADQVSLHAVTKRWHMVLLSDEILILANQNFKFVGTREAYLHAHQ